MQTAKTLMTLLALGLCVVSVSQARPDTEAQAKEREATRKKIAELQATPVPDPDAVPGAVFAEPPASAAGAGQPTPEQTEHLRDATRQKIAELNAQGKTAPPVAAGNTAVKPAPATVFAPISGPPTNLSATKEGRLTELLRKYKADEITPQEYQTERAKILADP
jgi:hypothetical protein